MLTSAEQNAINQLILLTDLINKLKEGHTLDIFLLPDLIRASLLGPKKNDVLAAMQALITWCNGKIIEDNSNAIYLLGYLTEHGLGLPVDLEQAITLYEKAISLGNTDAMVEQGRMLQYGIGGPSDETHAVSLYGNAIRQGNARAMYYRASMFRSGRDRISQRDNLIKLYERSLRLGYTPAMTERASMYQYGEDSPVDYSKAIELYELAIQFGNPVAMYRRADMHHYGFGGPVAFDKAIALYEQCIPLGNTDSMKARAWMYEEGKGCVKDKVKAARLYRLGAANNSFMAQYSLSRSTDPVFSYHYFMDKKYFGNVAELMLTYPEAIREFFAFDCEQNLSEALTHLETLHDIMKGPLTQDLQQDAWNQFWFLMLDSLDACEKKLGYSLPLVIEHKKYYLNQLNLRNLDEQYVIPAMELAINTWYGETWIEKDHSKFTQTIARFLTRGLGRVIASEKENECQDLLTNIAIILGKNLYGKHYKIYNETFNVSMPDVLALMSAAYDPTSDPSLSTNNNHAVFFKSATVNKEPPESKPIKETEEKLFNAWNSLTRNKRA